MTKPVNYRTKFIQSDGDLKVIVTANYQPGSLEVTSEPLDSERDAKAQVDALLTRQLETL